MIHSAPLFNYVSSCFYHRTKWKRQTAVGLELLAEAGNYAAFQRLYGSPAYLSPWSYAPAHSAPHLAPNTPIDLYYRQAAAAAVLQKPISYRMYSSVPSLSLAGGAGAVAGGTSSGLPLHPSTVGLTHFGNSSTTSSLTPMAGYYTPSSGEEESSSSVFTAAAAAAAAAAAVVSATNTANSPSSHQLTEMRESLRDYSASPPLNPGSPPTRSDSQNSCPPPSHSNGANSDSEDAPLEV